MSIKKTPKDIFAAYDRQIRNDIGFWIKYRPSRWGILLLEKPLGPLIKLIKTKSGKRYVFFLALIFSLFFVGVIPTINFIWSNIFRLWLILLIIPLLYWSFAITSVYAKVIIQAFCQFIKLVFYELTERWF